MSNWQPMDINPAAPMNLLYFSAEAQALLGDLSWADLTTVEKYDTGYWDGQEFFYAMTNHRVFEWSDDRENLQKPTHWMPLPDPPITSPPDPSS